MKKILLVSTVIVFYERHKSLLNRDEFQILTATTGKEALQVHRTHRVDLIITDLNMPDMGGEELCQRVRNERELRNVSVLLICRDTADELMRVVQCSANAWITKPVDPDKLLDNIGQLLAISMRKGYRVLLKAKVGGVQNSVPFFCTSHNISITGMLIETDKRLDTGDRISCEFFLPGPHKILADGETVRSSTNADGSHQYGIRFIDLAPHYREVIEKFVASVAPKG